MNGFTRHVVIPAIAPTLIVILYFTPITLIGCYKRGIIALIIMVISLIAGTVAAVFGFRGRIQGDPEYLRWVVTAIILAIPALLLIGPLG